ncbi:MAG TPA: alpha/beta hydrolase [Streptosporangiales bacterium]
MTSDELAHRFLPGAGAGPVFVALHGTGGTPDDLVPVARELSPDAPVLAPAGPVSEHGMARWFRRLAEGVFDTEDVIARTQQLAGFLQAARAEHGLGDRPLVAVGFSNGANIAAALTLLRPDVLTRAVLFNAMTPVPDPPLLDLTGTYVLLVNGRRDPMAPTDSAERLVALLRERSADVQEHWHAGGHQLTVDGLVAAKRWFAAQMTGLVEPA